MQNPTHFIEVQKGGCSGKNYQSSVFPIEIMELCLASTKNTALLKTVAIFKIKLK